MTLNPNTHPHLALARILQTEVNSITPEMTVYLVLGSQSSFRDVYTHCIYFDCVCVYAMLREAL